MAKVSYSNLKLKSDTSTKTIKVNDMDVEILNYLPVSSKYDLVMITIEKSLEGPIINPIKLEIFFNLNLVYSYSNIAFTDKQRESEEKLYDTLYTNGVIDAVVDAIDEDEYKTLYTYIESLSKSINEYNRGAASAIETALSELTKGVSTAAEMLKNFDVNKYQDALAFAKALNCGRDIPNEQ